jgi:protein SCO1/2
MRAHTGPGDTRRRTAGGLIALVLIASCTSTSSSPTTAPPLATDDVEIPADTTFIRRPVDRVAPEFALTDQDGNAVTLSDLRGRWILMDWVFTNCVTFCPLLTNDMTAARQGLEAAFGENLHMVTITFDPERDTVEALKAFSSRMTGGADGWSWLTGSAEQTDAVAADYGVSFDPTAAVAGVVQYDHTSLMVVVGPDGRERYRYFGYGWADDVIALMADLVGVGAPVAAPDVQPTPSPAADYEALAADAIILPWEEWELEPGVTSQALYQFPNTGTLRSYVDAVVDDAEAHDRAGELVFLAAMHAWMIPRDGERFLGIGYVDNLAIVVEGDTHFDVMTALLALDEEWCCSTPGA